MGGASSSRLNTHNARAMNAQCCTLLPKTVLCALLCSQLVLYAPIRLQTSQLQNYTQCKAMNAYCSTARPRLGRVSLLSSPLLISAPFGWGKRQPLKYTQCKSHERAVLHFVAQHSGVRFVVQPTCVVCPESLADIVATKIHTMQSNEFLVQHSKA